SRRAPACSPATPPTSSQGVAPRVMFDLGDFIDDYVMHPKLRNDLGLLWLVELSPDGAERIRALPLALEYCFTRRASPAETPSGRRAPAPALWTVRHRGAHPRGDDPPQHTPGNPIGVSAPSAMNPRPAEIPLDRVRLAGDLAVPQGAVGIVAF